MEFPPDLPPEAREVLEVWFGELEPRQWFEKDPELDRRLRERFADLHERLAREVPGDWTATPHGLLAAVIVLDQIPRNVHRGTPRAFATDAAALALAERALARGDDRVLDEDARKFLYMPFQHAEDLEAQRRSVALCASLDPKTRDYAERHLAVIERFGRFPHRNRILGRESTPEEEAFLAEPGSSF